MPFGSYLREKRESHKWTIKEVADRLGFSGSYISQLENGSRIPSHKQLEALAKGYGIDIEEINRRWTEAKIHKVSADSNYKFDIKSVGEKRVHEVASKVEQGLEELKKAISNDGYIKMPVVNKFPTGDIDAALESSTGFCLLPREDVPSGHRVFGFRVDGLSLPDAGILAGDFLIIDPDQEPKSGDIVVLETPDGLVMSYYHERGEYIELRPETAGFKKAYLKSESRSVGRLVYHVKKY